MSYFNQLSSQRLTGQLTGLFLLITLCFGLSACQTLSSANISAQTQEQLDRIDIKTADTRLQQIFNRHLIDNLNQNAALRDLTLTTTLTVSNSSTLAVRGKSSTLSKTSMNLAYMLSNRVSDETLTSGTITATATSGTISSYYGKDKSKQFAAERLTRQLADKLTLRLKRFFLEVDAPKSGE